MAGDFDFIDGNFGPNNANYLQTLDNGFTWYPTPNDRSRAFEAVQEAILDKIAEAVEDDNIKRAKELLALAKKLKELK